MNNIVLKISLFLIFVLTVPWAAAEEMDSWMEGNLIGNGNFMKGEIGGLPLGWDVVCPNKVLAPEFRLVKGMCDGNLLMVEGNGRSECFGFVRYPVDLPANKTFRMRVRFRVEGIEDINRHLLHGIFGDFNDGIFRYRLEKDWIIGENRFPGKGGKCEVRLYFRFSATGKVWWDKVTLQECEPAKPRLVRIAASWGKHDMDFWSQWLDFAGSKGVDIAELPEMCNGKRISDAEPIDGPTGQLLASKAKQWKMYVSGTFYEKRGDIVYNTAIFFDRKGELVGTYEKQELYEPELDEGATPGVLSPVFETDFGKVGILICYDNWFPETIRLLSYKGAELVLIPNAGYFTDLMPARAADNGVWIVVSSLDGPAGIWDSGGARAGKEEDDPTRHCPTSIKRYEKYEENYMIIATVDLSQRWSPHWWGGPMRSAPGGRRVRQTVIKYLEDEIAQEVKSWYSN